MTDHQRKKLGIKGAIKLPKSNYFLVPGSLWSKWKTVVHADPECDETELEILCDIKGVPILDEKGDKQEVFRHRNLKNLKDQKYYEENKIRIYPEFASLEDEKGQAGSLYVGKDGKLYDPSKDVWMENITHEKVRELGGIFINDTFMHLWKVTRGILFLDGSYGSGKTTFAITHLLRLCLDAPKGKFNCFYGRQEKEMARQLHRNIIEEIKRNHWEDLFDYSEADNGSKNIHCKHNDGLFQLFGCDDEKTIKGWNNPTHILIDEVNQIPFTTFGMLLSRLRRPGVDCLLIGCFNACDVIPVDSDEEGSWLWRYIFKDEAGTTEDEMKKKVFKSMGVIKHHSDYLDNYCQNHHAYWYKLLVQAGFDTNKANRFANGDWGTKLNAQLYYHRFSYEKHVRPKLDYHPALPILNGWDENTQPYQPSLIVQRHGNQYWFIKEYCGINPCNNVSEVSKMIIKDFSGDWFIDGEGGRGLDHRAGWHINGDATSKKEDSKLEKGQNYFTIIQNQLKVFKPEIRVQDANPNNKTRGEFLNLIFHHEVFGISILISEEGCPNLIKDLQNTMQDTKNEKKSGHKDKSTKIVNGVRQVQPYGHLGDTMDYIICENSMIEYLTYQNGDMTVDAVGGRRAVRNSYEKGADGRIIKEESSHIKWNKKSRGDWKYDEVKEEPDQSEEDSDSDDEITFSPKNKSRNSW